MVSQQTAKQYPKEIAAKQQSEMAKAKAEQQNRPKPRRDHSISRWADEGGQNLRLGGEFH